MNNLPFVSVVVCIYNGDGTLSKAIDSLLNQGYPRDKYEIILLNDGSKNDCESICLDFLDKQQSVLPKITYAHQKNAGLGSARNSGISLSKGDIIAFIDQDATANVEWISELVKAFGDDMKVGVVGGKIDNLNADKAFPRFIHWAHYYMENSRGKEIIPIVGTNMAFRKEVFSEQRGFFENFVACGDETSLVKIKVLPHYRSAQTKGAVVLHERPWSLRQWLRERFRNGHEYALQRKLGKADRIQNFLYALSRLSTLMIPFLFLPVIIQPALWSLIIASVIPLFLSYRCFVRDSILTRIRILAREYSVLQLAWTVPAYIMLTLSGKFLDDYGFMRGARKYSGAEGRDIITSAKIQRTLFNS